METIEKLYIRFSDDIYEDINRGFSYFKGGVKLDGICAWNTGFENVYGIYRDEQCNEVTTSDIAKYAREILKNTYGSYSSNEYVHIITGDFVGTGNDGVLLRNIKVLESIRLTA